MPPEPVLDLPHLDRQTFFDRELARELLGLFDAQCRRLLPVLASDRAGSRELGEAAHALRGAASAVGAAKAAAILASFEASLAGATVPAGLGEARARVLETVGEARDAAAAFVRA